MSSHITIRDLAKATGYSTATVSKALRHHPDVPEGTREKIQKVADELGYRPHAMIRALMSQVRDAKGVKTSAIPLAMLNPWNKTLEEQSSFTAGIIAGCRDRAEALGYRLDVFDLKRYSNKRLDDVLQARGIQGILIPPMGTTHAHLRLSWERYVPVVLGGYSLRKPSPVRVMPDHFDNLSRCIREVKHQGYRRVGVLLYRPFDRRCNLAFSAAAMRYAETQPPSGRVQVLDAIDASHILNWVRQSRLDAVIAWHPTLMEILKEGGFSIPGDLGFALCTNAAESPDISGLDEQPRRIGAVGVDTLIAHLHRYEFGIPEQAYTIRVPGLWQDGETLHG
ncbi:MAG: LacI family DNA-binding transcriptional regulator [Verrucomicrobia bacterium]|nr:LacI family DNA-binding transcriptional regulator [Verrucomicrobiota bacterium]MCH8512537.1 LacI family transcriptional regulator [Kiritimatiellia bacterium]